MIDRDRLGALLRRERAAFAGRNPRSAAGYARAVITEFQLPWSVTGLGARVEYRFIAPAPATGTESTEAADGELDDYFHVYLANRGVLLTPFHNMALISPATTYEQVARHAEVFRGAVEELTGPSGPS